jgi:hypothetical protein
MRKTAKRGRRVAPQERGREVQPFTRDEDSASVARPSENADHKLKDERAVLEAHAFGLIARRREVNIEIGRVFIRIKATLEHGRWKPYFKETFASSISFRTAQRYMKRARPNKADGDKNDELSLFKPAGDPQAVKMRDATAKAEADVGHRQKVRLDGIFKLPLSLTIDEQEAARELLNSPDWPRAQREIITLLKQLYVKFGIVNADAPEGVVNEDVLA